MAKIFSCFITLLFTSLIVAQSSNMTMECNWDDDTAPVRFGAAFNDVWGFVDGNGNEVAVIGGTEEIFFIDVSDCSLLHSYEVQNQSGTVNKSLWRDFKSYGNYIYAVADEGTSGLLIFDLSDINDIPAPVQIHTFWDKTHNIFIDEANARLYAAGSDAQSNGLVVLALDPGGGNPANAEPDSPVEMASVSLTNYIHDVYVRDNIAYASQGTSKFRIWDMTDPTSPVMEGEITAYPEQGYNHSSWLTDDGTAVIFADETHGKGVKYMDITDPTDLSVNADQIFKSQLIESDNNSIAHNPFIKGDLVFISYYHDGIQVFNISDPDNITSFAYYDTYPANTGYSGYAGAWGCYPYLPSEKILGSDDTNGLFVLSMGTILPVEFLLFTVKKQKEDHIINWSVAKTILGKGFDVEYSRDGKDFTSLGWKDYDDKTTNYEFVNENPGNGRHYYRIKMHELDGKFDYSEIRTLISSNDSFVRLVNSEVIDELIIEKSSDWKNLEIRIFSSNGQLVHAERHDSNNSSLSISLGELMSGIYTITMHGSAGTRTEKFVKM